MNKRFLVFLTCFFLSFTISLAQGWEKTYDGGFNERTTTADRTGDGGIIMAGRQIKSITDTQVPFIYKTDIDGNLQWEFYKTEEENEVAGADAILVLNDGNIFWAYYSDTNIPTTSSFILEKLNPNGTVIWSVTMDSDSLDGVKDVKETDSGDLILVGGYSPNFKATRVIRMDADGNIQWSLGFNPANTSYWPGGLIPCTDDGVVVLGYSGAVNDNQNAYAKRIDGSGNIVWEKEYIKPDAQFALDGIELPTGEFLIGGMTSIDLGEYDATLYKLNSEGDEIWEQIYVQTGSQNILRMRPTLDGNIVLGGHTTGLGAGAEDLYLIKLDTAGNQLWHSTFGRSKSDILGDLMVTEDNEFYLAGYTQNPDNSYDAYLVKTDSLGRSFTNLLTGNLYHDQNLDCLPDAGEDGMQQWLIKANKDQLEYLALTDSAGNYFIELDSGNYDITVFPISPFWDICTDSFSITFTGFFDTIVSDPAAQAIIDCPYLEVSIGTPFLRRCFESTYSVQYCNYGTMDAENAYVDIVLDPFMEFIDASIPLDAQNGDTLSFLINDVEIGECSDFTLNILLEVPGEPCDSIPFGMTHCVEASIYSDSLCLPPTNDWSGASIEVDAICEGDSITFFIQNVGTSATQANLEYVVIEDDVILLDGNFTLNPAEVQVVTVSTNGSTFRLEAEQEPNHPWMIMPSVSVEGCGDENVEFSFGFVNVFSQNDGFPHVDIDCMPNIGAYDPNDKTGFPLGYTENNYINRGQDIEYLIRFQNTGTDTAFTVVIRDQLSEFLNLASVRPGAASHPYDFDISNEGEINFTFNDIMLPDSNVNLAASQGFVKFKVAQQPDLALETQIYNAAAIYFDFNTPVITNQTLHSIGEPFITAVIDQPTGPAENFLKVFPNPFRTIAMIDIEGVAIDDGTFNLYDLTGRLLKRQYFSSNQFTLSRNDLQAGIYFFTVENNGQIIGSGKLIAQ